MDYKNEEKNYLDGTDSVSLIMRWKKPLLIVAIIATVVSYILSGPTFIKPKYKSTVIFFPTVTNSLSQALLTDVDKKDIMEFGSEEQAEQLLQILNSDQIKDIIARKYNLMSHYGIDSASDFPRTYLHAEMESNITFERTEFMSVKIDVLDTDPQMAANIANDISIIVDSVKNNIQRVRATEGLKIMEAELHNKLSQIDYMEDSLKTLRDKGIFDYVKQSVIMNEEYTKASAIFYQESAQLPVIEQYRPPTDTMVIKTKARIKGAEARMKHISEKLHDLADYGGANVSLTEILMIERSRLGGIRERYEKIKVDADKRISQKFVVNNAVKAEKKYYPIRWLIVLISVTSALLLTIILLIVLNSYSNSKALKN